MILLPQLYLHYYTFLNKLFFVERQFFNITGATIGAVQVINKKSYHDDGDTFTLDGIFHDEDEIIIESLCQHLRLAFETCGGDRTEESFQKKTSITSIIQTKNKTISTTGSKNTDGGSNGESGNSGSNTVVDTEDLAMLSLSTEALLRFELKHRATGDQRQSNVGTLQNANYVHIFI